MNKNAITLVKLLRSNGFRFDFGEGLRAVKHPDAAEALVATFREGGLEGAWKVLDLLIGLPMEDEGAMAMAA